VLAAEPSQFLLQGRYRPDLVRALGPSAGKYQGQPRRPRLRPGVMQQNSPKIVERDSLRARALLRQPQGRLPPAHGPIASGPIREATELVDTLGRQQRTDQLDVLETGPRHHGIAGYLKSVQLGQRQATHPACGLGNFGQRVVPDKGHLLSPGLRAQQASQRVAV